jgi:hypothetical protein
MTRQSQHQRDVVHLHVDLLRQQSTDIWPVGDFRERDGKKVRINLRDVVHR